MEHPQTAPGTAPEASVTAPQNDEQNGSAATLWKLEIESAVADLLPRTPSDG